MPLSRRLELLKWANDCNGYIIEDDYDGSFATLVSRFLLYKVLIQMNALFIWELSQNLFTFFTNGICCFTTTPLKIYQELHGIFKQTVATIQKLAFANFIQGNWERHLNRSRTLYKENIIR